MKKRISLILACLIVLSLSATVIADNARSTAELAESVSLPAALVKGDTYTLSVPETDSGALNVTVNGQSYSGSFVAEGNEAVIAYTTADGGEVGTYTLPVIDTQESADQAAYFYDPSGTVSGTKNENDLTLSFSKDAQTSFIKKLSSEDLGIYLSMDEAAANYEKLSIKLTDGEDATVSLTFVLDMAAKTVSLGNVTAQLEEWGDALKLRYKNGSGKLMLDDADLIACENDDSGNAFHGFSGGVYLTLGFEGVSGKSSVRLTRVGNQALGHKNSTTPDMAEPVLALTSALYTTQYMGEEFDIPTYEIYDVLSQVVESSVSVEAPDGQVYNEAFTISQYGKYKVTFIAKDSYGNTMKSVKMIFVNDDIAPELTVSAMEKTSCKLGDAVPVPAYTVSDNLDAAVVDVILILPDYQIRVLTHDEAGEITYCLTDTTMYSQSFCKDNTSFIAEQSGTYTIRYVAYDDQYNRSVQELTFTVE